MKLTPDYSEDRVICRVFEPDLRGIAALPYPPKSPISDTSTLLKEPM